MTLLVVDAGNARLKWAMWDRDAIGALQHADYSRDPEAAVAALCDAAEDDVTAIAVSNVAGREFEERLSRGLTREQACKLWFARSTRTADGVRNGYAVPELLGVDRWAALVGGYARVRADGHTGPLCIADAGTALTIDAMLHDGTHLGGLILPGLRLQRTALLESTADIALNARAAPDPPAGLAVFATDTAGALARSGAFACAAAIDRCAQQLADELGPPRVLLAGGDAQALSPWLATSFEICPNLVFEGLAILHAQRGPG